MRERGRERERFFYIVYDGYITIFFKYTWYYAQNVGNSDRLIILSTTFPTSSSCDAENFPVFLEICLPDNYFQLRSSFVEAISRLTNLERLDIISRWFLFHRCNQLPKGTVAREFDSLYFTFQDKHGWLKFETVFSHLCLPKPHETAFQSCDAITVIFNFVPRNLVSRSVFSLVRFADPNKYFTLLALPDCSTIFPVFV